MIFVLSSVTTPLNLVFMRNFIDSIAPFATGEVELTTLLKWGGLTFLTLTFLSTGNMLTISLEVGLNKAMTENFIPAIGEKLRRLEYAAFEDPDLHNTINRMSDDPIDRFVRIFIYFTRMWCMLITFTGIAIVFAQLNIWFCLVFYMLFIPTVVMSLYRQMIIKRTSYSQTETDRKLDYLATLASTKNSVAELKIFGAAGYIMHIWRGEKRFLCLPQNR